MIRRADGRTRVMEYSKYPNEGKDENLRRNFVTGWAMDGAWLLCLSLTRFLSSWLGYDDSRVIVDAVLYYTEALRDLTGSCKSNTD